MSVVCAADGDRAFRLASEDQQPIQLLLTDVVMPEVSGPRLAERLAALRPGAKVIFMSGYPTDGDLGADLKSLTNFIQKPFTKEQLLRKIRSVLDGG